MTSSPSGDDIVVSTPLRTAIGTFGGQLKDTPAVELGATIAAEVLTRSGLNVDQVDQVIVGNVLQAGQGMNPGRQVALKAGLPATVPGMTINRVCGSGLQAIVSASQQVALVLATLLGVWIVRSLRHTVWTTERNIGRTVSGLLAGIVLVDLLAVVPAAGKRMSRSVQLRCVPATSAMHAEDRLRR